MAATAPSSRGAPQQVISLRAAPTGSGSQTETQSSLVLRRPVLRLRGESRAKSNRKIQWAEDVVDNEGLGRKSSKVCCIYHAPKSIDESSDESSSDSSSDDESGADDGGARPVRGRKDKGRAHNHGHGDGEECGRDHTLRQGKRMARTRSPNAYEKMPKVKDGNTGRIK